MVVVDNILFFLPDRSTSSKFVMNIHKLLPVAPGVFQPRLPAYDRMQPAYAYARMQPAFYDRMQAACIPSVDPALVVFIKVC